MTPATWPRRDLLRLGAGLSSIPFLARAQPEGNASAGAQPASDQVWTPFFAVQRLWAYADRLTLQPGDRLNVMASTAPGQPDRRARLELFRIDAQNSTAPVWISDFAQVTHHGATASAASLGPGWPISFADIDTSAWRPGVYSADLVEQTTATRDMRVFQLIVRNVGRPGAILCKLGANTWQAYNSWGGHSLYPNGDDVRRGLIVSFDRPTPPSFFEYDIFLVRWLESIANSCGGVDYASNFDVHAIEGLLDKYKIVITSSHDEYWSKEEFDAFWHRIFVAGKNTCFLGGNTAYCQVRYGDLNCPPGGTNMGRQLVCFKKSMDPILARTKGKDRLLLATANFREGARRPETMMLGGAYQGWFDPASDEKVAYVVADDQSPWFAGTGLKRGDVAAEVVGYEWDNRDPDGDGRRLWREGVSGIAQLDPESVQVLMRGFPVDVGGRRGLAEATLYRSPAGARVFNAGSVRWAWGLGKVGYTRPEFVRFNENLIRDMLRGRPERE